MDHWYDASFAFITQKRKASFDFTRRITLRPGNVFVALQSHASSSFPANGAGETIATICGYADTPQVIDQFPAATVLSSDAQCAHDSAEALQQLRDGRATVFWYQRTDAAKLGNEFKTLGPADGVEWQL